MPCSLSNRGKAVLLGEDEFSVVDLKVMGELGNGVGRITARNAAASSDSCQPHNRV